VVVLVEEKEKKDPGERESQEIKMFDQARSLRINKAENGIYGT